MKTVFDQDTRDELIRRINTVTPNSTARWGKMNVNQMLRHCTLWEEWVAGRKIYKRAFLGRIFGKMALNTFLKDDRPLGRNSPTISAFTIARIGDGEDIASGQAKWIALIQGYAHFSNPGFIHSFFGKMTKEQIGQLAYKHADHHLRQFNC